MEFLKIDGGHGEGGGQIIRSAITLSCITKTPIHLDNIRKNRKVQGLRPQHLTAIKLLQRIANAKTFGAEIGSTDLKFIPGKVESLELLEDIGTAGSIPLILQVLIPLVSISQKDLDLTIKGGTDVPWSPSIDYTQLVLKEAYSRMGIKFFIQVNKRGYYPKGNGEVRLRVYPSKINSISFRERETKYLKLICSYSKISQEKIKAQIEEIKKNLVNENFIVKTEVKKENALDEGASLLIYSVDENSVIGIDSLFDKKMQKFDFDLEKFRKNCISGVDENLVDMLIVPASLGKDKTVFQVSKITKHLETNLYVTSKITGCKYGIGKTRNGFEVIVEGVSNPSIK